MIKLSSIGILLFISFERIDSCELVCFCLNSLTLYDIGDYRKKATGVFKRISGKFFFFFQGKILHVI